MTQPELAEDSPTSTGRWAELRAGVGAQLSGPAAGVALAILGLVAVLGLWLRFASTSLLWLDEALSVNIAELPLSKIPAALKRDGAPPLYYVLLHFWTGIFGSGDHAVRGLSALCSILAVFGLFFLVRRVFGLEAGLVATGILLASGFATYYANEARMYALVMFLVVLLGWAVVLLAERPTIGRAGLVWLSATALLYTHYWSFFLLGAVVVWMVARSIRPGPAAKAGRLGAAAIALAGVAFLPWFPIFSFQSAHTGTPWAKVPDMQIALTGILHFYDNQGALPTAAGPDLAFLQMMTVGLVVLAVFGAASGRFKILVDLTTQPRGRFLAFVTFGTLALGIVGAHLSKSTFVPRYASVILIPLIVLMALGTQVIAAPWLRVGVIAALAVGMLTQGLEWRTTQRSQAGEVAAVLKEHAKPGDTLLFCPDQLGPTVMRVLPDHGLRAVGYPRLDDPRFVNWVDYLAAIKATSPQAFAKRVKELTGDRTVWLAWATGYGPYQSTCAFLASTFLNKRGWGAHTWVDAHQWRYFQSINLTQFNPPNHSDAAVPTP